MNEIKNTFSSLKAFLLVFAVFLSACDIIPKEAVELSVTVGRDLEEVHATHLALAELHFQRSKDDVNEFIDEIYTPAFMEAFAREFDLPEKVTLAINTSPKELLPGLTSFITIAHQRIENKRNILLSPIEEQEREVIGEINSAHMQLQAAQAIVTGHLASVRKVRDVQNELLAEVGLEGLREKIATTTSEVSSKVGQLVTVGEVVLDEEPNAIRKIEKIDAAIREFADGL